MTPVEVSAVAIPLAVVVFGGAVPSSVSAGSLIVLELGSAVFVGIIVLPRGLSGVVAGVAFAARTSHVVGFSDGAEGLTPVDVKLSPSTIDGGGNTLGSRGSIHDSLGDVDEFDISNDLNGVTLGDGV